MKRPVPERIVSAAMELLRASFRNDGAEGESVHIVCDEVDRLRERIEALEAGLREARAFLDKDRTGLADALDRIRKEIAGRSWIADGRGPYAWDDERYKAEAGEALRRVDVIAYNGLTISGTTATAGVRAIDASLSGTNEKRVHLFFDGPHWTYCGLLAPSPDGPPWPKGHTWTVDDKVVTCGACLERYVANLRSGTATLTRALEKLREPR